MVLTLSAAHAQPADAPLNSFGDPFFTISTGIADCPEPLGPRVTEAQRRGQAHYRVERGTTCWLTGLCSRPNSYAYDQDIAAAVGRRLATTQTRGLDASSLWVTVQRRVITVEGCVPRGLSADTLLALMRPVADVERVVVNIRTGPAGAPPPYPVYAPRPAPGASAAASGTR